jgi:hypothetical protein
VNVRTAKAHENFVIWQRERVLEHLIAFRTTSIEPGIGVDLSRMGLLDLGAVQRLECIAFPIELITGKPVIGNDPAHLHRCGDDGGEGQCVVLQAKALERHHPPFDPGPMAQRADHLAMQPRHSPLDRPLDAG